MGEVSAWREKTKIGVGVELTTDSGSKVVVLEGGEAGSLGFCFTTPSGQQTAFALSSQAIDAMLTLIDVHRNTLALPVEAKLVYVDKVDQPADQVAATCAIKDIDLDAVWVCTEAPK